MVFLRGVRSRVTGLVVLIGDFLWGKEPDFLGLSWGKEPGFGRYALKVPV
ncbi:hypothetical protein [Brunnivagina elsteri]|nr:hypothetical protein [Calothrix elsteri]